MRKIQDEKYEKVELKKIHQIEMPVPTEILTEISDQFTTYF